MYDKALISQLPELEPAQVFVALDSTPAGLSTAEARRRLQLCGPNVLPKPASRPLWRLLMDQLVHFMALLLWVAGAMAFAIDMPELGVATWAVVLINAVFSFWQEYRAERALSKLADLLPRRITLLREGRLEIVPAMEVVPGDVLVIEAGDHIPADARLVESEELSVDMSMLTGESMPVERGSTPLKERQAADQCANVVLAGTTVAAGRGIAVVYSTGRQTEFGYVAHLTAGVGRGKSTLELQVQRIVRLITTIALLMGAAVFFLAIWLVGLDVRESFIFCIGIIVANVPEGLLPTVSLSLAVGVQRMAGQNALVRRLSAVETLCATTVICTDKTGTLTMNEVTVKQLWLPDGSIEVTGGGYDKAGQLLGTRPAQESQIQLLLTIGILCSEAELADNPQSVQSWKIVGDPTEAALLVVAAKRGLETDQVRPQFRRELVIPFSSARKMMTTVDVNLSCPIFQAGEVLTMVKGAPLELLRNCTAWLKNGEVTAMGPADRALAIAANDDLARSGHRVLALAYRSGETLQPPEQALTLAGLVAMIDPPRPDVAEAMQLCRRAGVRVAMVTGDYGLTAAAIGRQIGLVQDNVSVVTGADFSAMDEAKRLDLLRQEAPLIFARANPENKLQIVEAFKAMGEIVAVTGDGVNDAPALKAAHIGIAMGRGGTDVAREVADIILLDDHFSTIVRAIEQGRAIFNNIRKFMTYVLTSNVPEMTPFIAMVFAKVPPALNILQILAIDIGTDMLPALALGAEKAEQDVMERKPSDYSKDLLDRSVLWRAYGFLGTVEAGISFAAFLSVWFHHDYAFADIQAAAPLLLSGGADMALRELYQHATTMALASIIACQVGNVFLCRSATQPFWKIPLLSNKLLWLGIVGEIAALAAMINLPVLAGVLLTRPLDPQDWGLLLLCPLVMAILEELRRFLFERRHKRP